MKTKWFRDFVATGLGAVFFCALSPLVQSAEDQEGGKRYAIVIGNDDYEHARDLKNPINDANGVGAALKQSGWEVTHVRNVGLRNMLKELKKFCGEAEGAEAALFFYAGHGLEDENENYLLPVDAELAEEDAEVALELETLALTKVIMKLRDADIKLKTIVLDCCRDNPLDRQWLRGRGRASLAEINQDQLPRGTMVIYSTEPGEPASDGTGNNSPFTAAFLNRIQKGGSVFQVFGDLASEIGEDQHLCWRTDGSGFSLKEFQDLMLAPETIAPPRRGRVPPWVFTPDWVKTLQSGQDDGAASESQADIFADVHPAPQDDKPDIGYYRVAADVVGGVNVRPTHSFSSDALGSIVRQDALRLGEPGGEFVDPVSGRVWVPIEIEGWMVAARDDETLVRKKVSLGKANGMWKVVTRGDDPVDKFVNLRINQTGDATVLAEIPRGALVKALEVVETRGGVQWLKTRIRGWSVRKELSSGKQLLEPWEELP